MNEQFIEYWRQVAEFDYPALQAELATSEAELGKAKGALLLSIAETHTAEAARERAEKILRWMMEEKSLPDRKWQMRALMMAHDYFAHTEGEKG